MKYKISLFMRKPFKGRHFSLENIYFDLFKKFKHKKLQIEFKVSPFVSKGIFNRILICIWAYFNQGDLNHISGDINFLSIFLSKKKTINTIHDCYSMKRLSYFKKYIYLFFWIKIPFFKSKKIITVSHKTKQELLNYVKGDSENKISVIDNFISGKFIKSFKRKINKTAKILVIGTSENKNINNIIISLKKIKCEVIIIGKLNNDIESLLKKNFINYKNFISLSQKKIIEHYIDSDLLLYVSTYEGFGLPILEAQSIGRAVITSNLEPMKFVAGKGALLVNPKNVDQISNAIKKILTNKKIRLSLIKKGHENIKRFNKQEILQKHIIIYKNILNISDQ